MLVSVMAEPSSAMDQVAMLGTSPVEGAFVVSEVSLKRWVGLVGRELTGGVGGLVQAVEVGEANDARDEGAVVVRC